MTELENTELTELVALARKNDNEAVQKLIVWFRPVLFRCARIYVSNDQDAEDLLQETFIKAFSSLDSLSTDAAFPGWIRRICRNAGIDRTRRPAEHAETVFSEMPVPDDSMEYEPADSDALRKAEDAYTNEQRRQILYRILDTLPEEQRTVLVMKYYDNMGLKEIAEQLSLPMSTVTGRFSVAKNKVKTAVETIQKREGIRLYNIAPVPFFLWLLKSEENDMRKAISGSDLQGILINAKTASSPASAAVSPTPRLHQAVRSTMINPAAVQNTAEAVSRVSPAAILGIAAALTVTGGAGYYAWRTFGNGGTGTSQDPSAVTEPAVVTEPAPEIRTPEEELVFASDLELDCTGTENLFMDPDHFNPELKSNITGYPTGRNSSAYDDYFAYSYTADAVILEHGDGTRAVYSYDGRQLSEPFTEQVRNSPFMGFFLSDEETYSPDSSYRVFSEDFTQLTWKEFRWAHGETYSCIYQGDPGYLFMYQLPFYRWAGTLLAPTIYPVMSSYDTARENPVRLSGYAVLDRSSSVIGTAPGPVVGPFVNSFYPAVQSDDYDKYHPVSGNQDLPAAFVNGMTGEVITDYIYEDFGWFQDGYCPVKRDGKWTYINTLGQEISAPLFDDASVVYQGRAYVRYDGAMRLIDVPATEQNHLGQSSLPAGKDSGSPAQENVLTAAASDNYLPLVAEHYGIFYYNYLSAIGNNLVPNMTNVTEEFRQVLISRYNTDNYGLTFENDYIHIDLDTYQVTVLNPERIRAEFTVDIMNHYTGRTTGQAGVTMRVTMECGSDYNDWQILSSDVLDHSAVEGHRMKDITAKG